MFSASDAEGALRLERRVVETDAPLHVVEVTTPAAETRAAEARAAEARDAEARHAEARDAEARHAEARDAEARHAEARDADGGCEGGETFLLIHGYGCSSFVWRHWVPKLARRGRVLLVDLKGFGSAPKPDDERYSPVHLAAEVVDLVHEMDARCLTLVGHSLGGGVALLAAVDLERAGEGRIHRLVLLAPAAYRQPLPPFVWFSHRPRLASALLRLVGIERIMRWNLRSISHDSASVTEEQVRAYARAWKTEAGRKAAFAAGRQILPPDLEARAETYPRVAAPTLLIWGDDDRVVPLWVGDRLERELPDARLVVVESCGHMTPDERPEEAWTMVEAFLEEHPAG